LNDWGWPDGGGISSLSNTDESAFQRPDADLLNPTHARVASQTGTPNPPAKCAIDVSEVTIRSRFFITAAVSNEEADKPFPGYKTIKPYLRTTQQPG
jgi:hypothetical protein